MKCRRGYEVVVCKSAAGYYLGTKTNAGLPNCRLSRSYAETEAKAKNLQMDRQRECLENEFCNEGKGCFE